MRSSTAWDPGRVAYADDMSDTKRLGRSPLVRVLLSRRQSQKRQALDAGSIVQMGSFHAFFVFFQISFSDCLFSDCTCISEWAQPISFENECRDARNPTHYLVSCQAFFLYGSDAVLTWARAQSAILRPNCDPQLRIVFFDCALALADGRHEQQCHKPHDAWKHAGRRTSSVRPAAAGEQVTQNVMNRSDK